MDRRTPTRPASASATAGVLRWSCGCETLQEHVRAHVRMHVHVVRVHVQLQVRVRVHVHVHVLHMCEYLGCGCGCGCGTRRCCVVRVAVHTRL